jgi:DNA-binding NarL/FixJ family response regulator
MEATPVVLAEDEVLLREGLASVLAANGFEVVGQAGDARELLAVLRTTRPALAVIDIRMPPGFALEGLDAARTIRAERPEVAILLLSAHVEVEHALELLGTGGGVGYLLKSRIAAVDEFIEAARRVGAGGSVVDPSLIQELVGKRRREDPLAALSERESEVLALMAEGRSNAGIARRLWVTDGTVEKHVKSILAKLSIRHDTDDHRRVLAVVAYLDSV